MPPPSNSSPRQRIKGYSQSQGPARTFGGLNEFYALQDPRVRAFEDPRYPGESAVEISRDLTATGRRLNQGGQIEPDRNFSPREQAMLGGSRNDRVAAAKESGDFGRIRREYNINAQRAGTRQRMNQSGDIVERGERRKGEEKTTPTSIPYNSPNDTPEAASAAARRNSTLLPKTTVSMPTVSMPTVSMPTVSTPTVSMPTVSTPTVNMPQVPSVTAPAIARPTQTLDAPPVEKPIPSMDVDTPARFRSMTRGPQVSQTPNGIQIAGSYGTGTAMNLAPGRSGGMMPHPITGQMVPMKDYLAEQEKIQDTKFGEMPGGSVAERLRRARQARAI